MARTSHRNRNGRGSLQGEPADTPSRRFSRCRSGCGHFVNVDDNECLNCGARLPSLNGIDLLAFGVAPIGSGILGALLWLALLSAGVAGAGPMATEVARGIQVGLSALLFAVLGGACGLFFPKDKSDPSRDTLVTEGAIAGAILGGIGGSGSELVIPLQFAAGLGGTVVGAALGAVGGANWKSRLNAPATGTLQEHERLCQQKRAEFATYARQLLDIRERLGRSHGSIAIAIDATYDRLGLLHASATAMLRHIEFLRWHNSLVAVANDVGDLSHEELKLRLERVEKQRQAGEALLAAWETEPAARTVRGQLTLNVLRDYVARCEDVRGGLLARQVCSIQREVSRSARTGEAGIVLPDLDLATELRLFAGDFEALRCEYEELRARAELDTYLAPSPQSADSRSIPSRGLDVTDSPRQEQVLEARHQVA